MTQKDRLQHLTSLCPCRACHSPYCIGLSCGKFLAWFPDAWDSACRMLRTHLTMEKEETGNRNLPSPEPTLKENTTPMGRAPDGGLDGAKTKRHSTTQMPGKQGKIERDWAAIAIEACREAHLIRTNESTNQEVLSPSGRVPPHSTGRWPSDG